jgi:hypothetical protein
LYVFPLLDVVKRKRKHWNNEFCLCQRQDCLQIHCHLRTLNI